MTIAGGCLCKAVRYEIAAEPIATRVCWCRVCQYFALGGPAVSTAFPRNAITVSGEAKDYSSVADSGSVMHRRFCGNCGTHLFSEAEARPHLVFVRAGTLDDPELVRPIATIWTASAPTWACIDASLPQFEGQPPPVA
jgi:hypothetical protein